MLSIFLGMKSTIAKGITTKLFLKIFLLIFLFYFICNFFQSFYFIFHTQKVAIHCKKQNEKRIMIIVFKKKVIQSQKMSKTCPKHSKFLV